MEEKDGGGIGNERAEASGGEFVPADLRVGRIYRNDKHRLWNFAGVRC